MEREKVKSIGKCDIFKSNGDGYFVVDHSNQHTTITRFNALWHAERYCRGRDRRTPCIILGRWKIDFTLRNNPPTGEPRWHYTISRGFCRTNELPHNQDYLPMASDQLLTFITSFGFTTFTEALKKAIAHLNRLRGIEPGYDRQSITGGSHQC